MARGDAGGRPGQPTGARRYVCAEYMILLMNVLWRFTDVFIWATVATTSDFIATLVIPNRVSEITCSVGVRGLYGSFCDRIAKFWQFLAFLCAIHRVRVRGESE